jgi:carbonic anhydrase
MFEEGEANEALELLLQQIPKEIDKAVPIKARVRPSDLMPQNRAYYRFSGSTTSPPCTEGVRWVLMKKPMMASKSQIDALKHAILQDNNRPVQPLNGRIVLE